MEWVCSDAQKSSRIKVNILIFVFDCPLITQGRAVYDIHDHMFRFFLFCLTNFRYDIQTFKRQPHKMVKHTETSVNGHSPSESFAYFS